MEVKKDRVRVDEDNPSIQRIESRCINCGMCKNTCEKIVGIDHTYERDDLALCINCGQCIMNCPVGALCPKYDYKRVLNILNDTEKLVSISIAPAVRVSLAAEFGIEDGTNMTDIIPSILRKIGFDYVFDVPFGADVTVMEEAHELMDRMNTGGELPMYTSCCPSWVKYACIFHNELLPHLSTTKSPIGMQSTLIKTYFRELNNVEDDIISVVVAPCTSKKYEILDTDTDYVITVQELAMMIRECEIEFDSLKVSEFDHMLSTGSKSAIMFGRSGGVMEATLSTLYKLMTGVDPKEGLFHLNITEPITYASFLIKNKEINVAVIQGMKNVEEFLKENRSVHFVEVMNCPDGCVGGGGEPLTQIKNLSANRQKRIYSLNSIDSLVSYSYQNNEIKDLYHYYINDNNSHKLLHIAHNDLSELIDSTK